MADGPGPQLRPLRPSYPVRTERLLLRRATRDDLDATWHFRKLPEVHDWLGAATERYEAYRERFGEHLPPKAGWKAQPSSPWTSLA